MTTVHKWRFENDEDIELTSIFDSLAYEQSPNAPEMSENMMDDHLSTDMLRQIKTEISNYEVSSPSTSGDSLHEHQFKNSPQYVEFDSKKDIILNGVTQPPTECKVCGLPTNCFHYEVSSCNGCKTFFRRTIIMAKKHECRFKNSCNVRGGSRCRSCRYDQCILAGMDPTAIRFPQGFNSESAIEEVLQRKRVLTDAPSNNEAAVIPVKMVPRFDQTLDARIVDNLAYLEMKFRRLRESDFNSKPFYNYNVRDLLKLACELGNADKYTKPADWPLPITHFECTNKEKEGGKDKIECKSRHWLTDDLFLNIQYLKALPFFNELELDDQEILTMHVCLVNTVLVQSWYSYLSNSHTLVLPDGRKPIYHMHRKKLLGVDYPSIIPMELDVFCKNIDPLFRVCPDAEEYFLLKAIIFCHAETPGLSLHAYDVLEKHREIYASTLLKRMQARLGTLPGARKYADLLGLIEMFFHFAMRKREFHVLLSSMRVLRPQATNFKPPHLFERFVINS